MKDASNFDSTHRRVLKPEELPKYCNGQGEYFWSKIFTVYISIRLILLSMNLVSTAPKREVWTIFLKGGWLNSKLLRFIIGSILFRQVSCQPSLISPSQFNSVDNIHRQISFGNKVRQKVKCDFENYFWRYCFRLRPKLLLPQVSLILSRTFQVFLSWYCNIGWLLLSVSWSSL